MTIQHPSSAIASSAAKHGLLTAINTALAAEPEIDINFGLRFPLAFPDAVGVTGVRSTPSDQMPNGPRTRYDDIEIDVNIVCERSGFDETVEQMVSDRAYELLGLIDRYIRTGDNITLGDAVISCELGPHQSLGASAEDDQGNGFRLIEIAATFKALAFIRNS